MKGDDKDDKDMSACSLFNKHGLSKIHVCRRKKRTKTAASPQITCEAAIAKVACERGSAKQSASCSIKENTAKRIKRNGKKIGEDLNLKKASRTTILSTCLKHKS